MFKNNTQVSWLLPMGYWGICLLYIIVFAPFGLEDTDTGYIFGSSWDIYNGILPHRDFIYTRPAVPAFFHTLFIYISETYGYLLHRAFFYVQLFGYSFLALQLIQKKIYLGTPGTLYFLALLGAIFSIHNYPPMGWNTTDGVFFWIMGLYLLLNKEQKWIWVFATLFLCLGTLTKQSFFFMPLFLVAYLFFSKDWKRLKWVVIYGLLWATIYLALKYFTGSLVPMWEQIFHRTSGGDLVDAGIKPYYLAIKSNLLVVLVLALLLFISKKILPNGIVFLLFIGLLVAYFLKYFINHHTFDAVPYVMQGFLLFAGAFFIINLKVNKNYALPFLLVLLSWSVSISNGYRTPILFATPMLIALFLFAYKEGYEFKKYSVPIISIAVCFIVFSYGYQTPYRDSNRRLLNEDMGAVFPQLSQIKSDKETFDKYTELKVQSTKYPNFTVIPSMTLAHYLTKSINPIGTDWVLDVEINNKSEVLLKQLYDKNVTVFLEKEVTQEYMQENYKLMTQIQQNWRLVDENTYFAIYKPK